MTYYEKPTKELERLKAELGYYPKPADFTPTPDFPPGHRWEGRKRCHGWNTNKGRQCLGLAMVRVRPDFDKCKRHGGKSPRGMASATYKDGRTSRYAPKIPKYSEYLDDPDYLALVDEIALVTARINELVETVNIGESSRLWSEAGKVFKDLQKAITNQKPKEAGEFLADLDYLLIRGNREWAKWFEITNAMESRRRLVDTERKRIEAAEKAIRANRALQLFEALGKANRAVIIDRLDTIMGFPVDNKKKQRLLDEIGKRFREFISTDDI